MKSNMGLEFLCLLEVNLTMPIGHREKRTLTIYGPTNISAMLHLVLGIITWRATGLLK